MLLRRHHQTIFAAPVNFDMSTSPSQAAPTFVAACQQGKLPFPSTKARQQTLLKDAGVAEDISLSNADVKERAAALVWLRHAVANNIPPDTWSTLISPTLLANVRTLYPIPPAKSGADPAETDLHRLAKVVSLFMPDVPTSSSSATASGAPTAAMVLPFGVREASSESQSAISLSTSSIVAHRSAQSRNQLPSRSLHISSKLIL